MNNIERLYKEWQSLQPLKSEDQERLNRKFMLEFNFNSNHIEGNTLTYGQTELLLMFGQAGDSAKMSDLEEMKAHNVGLKMVQDEAKTDNPLTEYFIKTLHKTLVREDFTIRKTLPDGTPTSSVVLAGQYKTVPNSVLTSTGEIFHYAAPEETTALMYDLVKWYNQADKEGKLTPIELASVFHYRYIRIHPFGDGNGRIARLLVNYILLRHNYPMIIVESKDKSNYLEVLHKCDVAVGLTPSDGAHAELSDLQPFVEYMGKCLERALTISIKAARGESIEEKDDWRKSMKLKYRNKLNKPEKTQERVEEILSKSYKPLLEQIHRELSEFYSIFQSVHWAPREADYEIESSKDAEVEKYTSGISFTRTNSFAPRIFIMDVWFSQFRYEFKVKLMISEPYVTDIYKKEFSYAEDLSEQDKNDIVNIIGQKLNEFLESPTI